MKGLSLDQNQPSLLHLMLRVLKGNFGDSLNVILVAAAFNFNKLLLCAFFVSIGALIAKFLGQFFRPLVVPEELAQSENIKNRLLHGRLITENSNLEPLPLYREQLTRPPQF